MNWWNFVSLMWLQTTADLLYPIMSRCELMKFCIFDVITDNPEREVCPQCQVVNWWNFVSLMWLQTTECSMPFLVERCELMKFCIFDVITDNNDISELSEIVLWIDEILYLWCDYRQQLTAHLRAGLVVNWWNFVSLMWLQTTRQQDSCILCMLWIDEILYLWCDYRQHNILIPFDRVVVNWWNFVSLMWLQTTYLHRVPNQCLLWIDEILYIWCDYRQQVFQSIVQYPVVNWWNFVYLMWLQTTQYSHQIVYQQDITQIRNKKNVCKTTKPAL